MPLSLGIGKNRSTQELATMGAVTTQDLKGQGAGFRAGDSGGARVQKGTAQNKTEEGKQDPWPSLSSTVWCPARFSHLAGLGLGLGLDV